MVTPKQNGIHLPDAFMLARFPIKAVRFRQNRFTSVRLTPETLISPDLLAKKVMFTKTPFVNRHRELVELSLRNADFVYSIHKYGAQNITNWRHSFLPLKCMEQERPELGKSSLTKLVIFWKTKRIFIAIVL